MEQDVNEERTAKHRERKLNRNINRYMILDRVYGCANWLASKAIQKKCVTSAKIQAMRGAIYGYHVLLQALRDIELEDLNERLKVLEEKASKGVFVS